MIKTWAAFAVCFGGLVRESAGCSTVRVNTPDGPVVARTLELGGLPTASSPDAHEQTYFLNHPKGEAGGAALSYCNNTLGWQAKYKHVNLGWGEAMNIKGLTVSGHTFRESVYENEAGENSSKPGLCWRDFAQWAVANHESVAEVVTELKKVFMEYQGPNLPGLRLHWAVEDKTGQGVVIEYVQGKLMVHNNTVGVMTNDPPFDWHLRNLNNYVNLNPNMAKVPSVMQVDSEVGTVPRVLGHGSNLVGLPGSSTPADRFIRLGYLRGLSETNVPPRNISDGVSLAAAVIGAVYIPKGSIAMNTDDTYYQWEFTQWTLIKVPSLARVYFKGYNEDRWRVVHVDRFEGMYALFQGTIMDNSEDISSLGVKY